MITIFLDMDGVIADFEQHIVNAQGTPINELSNNAIHRLADTDEFFATIPKMYDFYVLMDGLMIHDIPVSILSATGKRTPDRVLEEKNRWLDAHLKGYSIENRHFVQSSSDKAQYALNEKCILIDDREKSVIPFRQSGGTAILHKNAIDTLTELKFIMNDLKV